MNFVKSLVFVASVLFLCAPSESSCLSTNDALSFIQNDRVYAFAISLVTAMLVDGILNDVLNKPFCNYPWTVGILSYAGGLTCSVAAMYYPGTATVGVGAFYTLVAGVCGYYLGHDAWQALQKYRKEKVGSESAVLEY